MARLRLRDRFFTPPVARALTSPTGILAAGAGVAAGIVVGLPVLAAAGIGAAAWGVRIAFSVPRNPTRERIDPFTLGEPWRAYVRDGLQAKARFDEAVGTVRGGPLRDRLREVGDRIDTGSQECWRIARGGQRLSDARKRIDVADITADLAKVSDDASERWAAGSDLARTAEALEAQLASATRMDTTIDETERRLRLLNARLDEAVARAIELSVHATDANALQGLEGDVDDVVTELESLRLALDETSGPGPTGAVGVAPLEGLEPLEAGPAAEEQPERGPETEQSGGEATAAGP